MANNAIVTQGSVITITTAGGTVFAGPIEDATGWSGPSFTRNEIDVTTLASTAKEYVLGLKDPGQFSIDVNYNIWDDPGQEALWKELNSNVPIAVNVRVPGAPPRGWDFAALVLNFESTAAVDDRLTGTITLRVTGDVLRIPNASKEPSWPTMRSSPRSSITITVPGGTPLTATIEDATGWSGPSFTRNEIDVTTLASTAKEYVLGLKDPGQFSVDVNYNIWDDAGQEGALEGTEQQRADPSRGPRPGHGGTRLGLRRAGPQLRVDCGRR